MTIPLSPPHRVKAAFYAPVVAFALLSLGMMTLMGWYAASELPGEITELLRERETWQHGEVAEDCSYEGEVTTRKFVFHAYTLKVAYTEAGGVAHTGTLEFDTLGTTLDVQTPSELRYDPRHPEIFALGNALDVATARWASVGVMGGASVGIVGLFAFLIHTLIRNVRRTRQCSRDGHLIEVAIVGEPTRDQHGNATYRFRAPSASVGEKPGSVVFGKNYTPLHRGGDARSALAIQSASDPRAVVLLRSDLFPFQFSSEDRDRILGANAKPMVA